MKHKIEAAVGVSVAIVAFLSYGVTGGDDPYISFAVSRNIADGGLTNFANTNGDKVQQSTSLMWVVLIGLLARLFQTNVVLTAHILSAVFFAAFVSVSLICLRSIAQKFAFAILVLASLPLSYWAMSGTEHPLSWFLLVMLLFRWNDRHLPLFG